ncbi:amidase family protein [Acidobacteria bacterium AH-259-G07]|nr:amidase family protein [Acidobacteria bacterium AH-259-G07]
MAPSELTLSSIDELAPRLAAGDVSPVEVTEAMLTRIAQHNGSLNAYITVMADSARDAAGAAEAAIRSGTYLGPLHGIPVAIKDLFATRGVRTTFGSPLFADWVPDYDASVVERLKRAGAIILGKTNLHELAFGTTSANVHYGPVRNPWDVTCHPGGSSGGSAAAVAAGLAFGALGSDTGASIRQPAACCGIVGLKPTFGRVSKFGGLPLSWSMDHVGPITRTVTDAALMLRVLAGHDPRDPGCVSRPVPDYMAKLNEGIRGDKIGVPRDYFFEDCDPEVIAAVEAALQVFRDLGATVEEITLPDMHAARAAGTVILFSEAAAYHAADMRKRPQAFSDEVRSLLEMGSLYNAVQLVQAQRLRRHLTAETSQALATFGAMLMPTSPVPPTPIADDPPGHAALRPRNTLPFDLISLPAISVPCGFTKTGLPVGLQIVGRAFDEPGVLRVARAYEQATAWHTQHPAL